MKLLLVAGARPNFMKIAPIIRAIGVRCEASGERGEALGGRCQESGGGRKENGGKPVEPSDKTHEIDLPRETACKAPCRRQGFHRGETDETDEIDQIDQIDEIDYKLVHTGQHYDYEMSKVFFEELDIPEPDYYLDAGSGSHAEQTAKVMIGFEKVCLKEGPDIVVVVGDVNSTLACSITAKKLNIMVAHVEAGLRSGDMTMPEEINRIVTDSIADYLFVTEKSGVDNLLKEGKPEEKIHLVGHVMIDNLLYQVNLLNRGNNSRFKSSGLKTRLARYAFLTLHRPSNVDHKDVLSGIAGALNEISREIPIIFPIHPRTSKMIDKFDINLSKDVHILDPLGFRESLFLWKDAVMVLTDSGGLQEETTALGVPCLTIRENTERPITIEIGTNILAGNTKKNILGCYREVMRMPKKGEIPPLWDGKAAERIVDILLKPLSTD